ncbi:MAG TPA: zinc metallopeptidase [Gaiellales bacterium]|nr:zinc metallopeptidase [Gaiellales bacterium]
MFFIIPLALGFGAQAWVRRAFADGSKIPSSSGMTGSQVSRQMLDSGGLQDVRIEGIGGQLSDHYDPRGKVMRLSEPVGNSSSVAAVAVAAHETGHAFQDARHEAGFRFRGTLVPATGFASQLWFPLVLFGFLTGVTGLLWVGIIAFAAVLLFQLVTLPVEFGASRKAMAMITAQGVISQQQVPAARKVLTAAALTYVVAALISVMQIVFLLGAARR